VGLLIINADDWGADRKATDAIAACFHRGAITSTTAMVWMSDSGRGASLAAEHGAAVGLHVNLDTPFTAPDVPAAARRDHDALRRHFASATLRRWSYSPSARIRELVASSLAAQLEEFQRLYERPPTHVDSHHHLLETSPDAFLSRSLGRGLKVRNAHWPQGSLAREIKVNWRRAVVRRRFITTDEFADLRAVHPALGGEGLDRLLSASTERSVELMVHPGFDDELPILLSEEWRAQLDGRPLGSFAALK
jgi:chitin disaccharide deacetylase